MVLNNLYQCGVCANSCSSVVPLLQFHQILIEKLYDVLKIYVNPDGFPRFACQDCLEKIEIFDTLIAELLKGQEHFYALKENMLHDLDGNGKNRIKSEPHSFDCQCEKENMLHDLDGNGKNRIKSEPHSFDCQCDICTDKYGLQLLADVIEQKESQASRELPNATMDPSVNQLITEPTPSTSAGPSSSYKTKQLKCTYCPKMFSHRGDMNKHLRTHTGEQPFSCHICQRKFKHTSNLKRHLTVHSGDKPYICNLCGKKFNRKDKMESHRRTTWCRKHSSQQNDLNVMKD
ncbi:Zinc finger, C2H2 type [Popillia japonica]|uniref:Zinc finger, C2H2 type n=1 Tax=Popillia japonica TaxID=7064 RepID=A0AAW1KKS5_POPJA